MTVLNALGMLFKDFIQHHLIGKSQRNKTNFFWLNSSVLNRRLDEIQIVDADGGFLAASTVGLVEFVLQVHDAFDDAVGEVDVFDY